MKVTVNNDSYSIDLIQSANPAEDAVHALAAIIEEDLPQRLANAELMLTMALCAGLLIHWMRGTA